MINEDEEDVKEYDGEYKQRYIEVYRAMNSMEE